MRLGLAFLACLFALNHGIARAAEVRAAPISGLSDTALIIVSGVLASSDGEQFRAAAAMYPKAIVAFQSTGGSLIAGIDIGTQIRLRNYTTLVPSGVLCASACATAWLGGTKRLMGPGALIGFHAAYIDQNGQATETGVGNALLGAYLNKLGLPDRAIVFITQAHPNDLTWLTMADAAREGIDVELFNMPSEAPSSAPGSIASPAAPVSPAAPSPPSTTVSLEQRASATLNELLGRLSQSTSQALPYLSSIYADEVMYYGKLTRKQDVLQDNAKYMARWPERSYAIIQDTVDCNSGESTCLLNGQMRWSARSTARNVEAYGTADFVYKFGFSSGAPQLLLQSSRVLTRSSRPIDAAVAGVGAGAPPASAAVPQYRDYLVARTHFGPTLQSSSQSRR